MIEALSWIFAILAITGSVMNGFKRPSGFLWWGASNIGLVWINYLYQNWALVGLFTFYTVWDIVFYFKWRKDRKNGHSAQ